MIQLSPESLNYIHKFTSKMDVKDSKYYKQLFQYLLMYSIIPNILHCEIPHHNSQQHLEDTDYNYDRNSDSYILLM